MKRHSIFQIRGLFSRARKTVAIAFMAVVAMPAIAQESTGTFSLIPKVGLSLANISNYELYYLKETAFYTEGVAKGKYNSRFMGGVEAEYQAFPTTSLSLGVFYSRQGCRISDLEFVGMAKVREELDDIRQSLDYINVPFTVNQYLTDGLAIKAGVQLGFLLNSELSYESTTFTKKEGDIWEMSKKEDIAADDKSLRNSLDVSIPIGLSYEYLNVVIDARYHLGLTRLYKDSSFPKEKNQLITLSVGYKFNL